MIGAFRAEGRIYIEIQPRFGGPYWKWLRPSFQVSGNSSKEWCYGISFSLGRHPKNWTAWIHHGIHTSPWDFARIVRSVRGAS